MQCVRGAQASKRLAVLHRVAPPAPGSGPGPGLASVSGGCSEAASKLLQSAGLRSLITIFFRLRVCAGAGGLRSRFRRCCARADWSRLRVKWVSRVEGGAFSGGRAAPVRAPEELRPAAAPPCFFCGEADAPETKSDARQSHLRLLRACREESKVRRPGCFGPQLIQDFQMAFSQHFRVGGLEPVGEAVVDELVAEAPLTAFFYQDPGGGYGIEESDQFPGDGFFKPYNVS